MANQKVKKPRAKRAAVSSDSAPSPEIQRDGEFWFDAAAADLAEEFFERFLVHTKGKYAGKPFKLEGWQRDRIVRPLFGWKRADGTRRYRTAYIEVPRKNGKSTTVAGIGLFLTFSDSEPGAEVYSAAADREQAAIVFNEAANMRASSVELRRRSHAFKRSIVVPQIGASYKVLSADAGTKHGLNAHGILFDELHTQRSRDLYDVLHTSTGSRRQPIEVLITTAGYDKHSICWEMHDYAIKVIKGIIKDDTFLPVIFAADEDDDWKNPETWRKANPNLGVSISMDYMHEQCEKAKLLPSYENTFKRLHLNIWTEQATRWLQMERWDACNGEIEPGELTGRACFGGIDLSSTSDITALVLVFPPEDDDERWKVLARFWVPEDNIVRRATRDRVPYDQWVAQGLITATEGNIVDYDVIRADVNALSEHYNIRELAIDRWNATQLSTQLAGDGFTVVPFGQGFASMAAPTKELEKMVLGAQLAHGAHPVLRWMASNVAVKQDPAGNIKPAKDKSTEKIDGIVALIMAIGRATIQPPEAELPTEILFV